MQNILIIGLGRFGRAIAMDFKKEGCDIMAVEIDETRANNAAAFIRNILVADAREESVMKSLAVESYDMCVISIDDDFQSALEITVLLKDFGARFILVKADTEIHKKLLLRNGADKVVCADLEMADRIAFTYAFDNVYDYVRLTSDLSIYEIKTPKSWTGHLLSEESLYKKRNLSILAVKKGDELTPLPSLNYVFTTDDHLVVLGKDKDIRQLI